MRDAIRSLSLLIAVGTGCGAPEPTSTDGVAHEGLSWVSAQPGKSLDGVYQLGERVLFFELRRGGPMESVQLDAPVKPMVDGRLMDSNGRVLMWQIAADAFIDPTWGTPEDIYEVTPDATARLVDAYSSAAAHAELGPPFLRELADATAPAGNEEEVRALQLMLGSFSATYDDAFATGDTVVASGGTYYHKVQVHSKPCCGIGEHSATKSLYKVCSGCSTRVYVNRCNHGECPGDTGMSLKCSTTWWGPRSNTYPKGDRTCTTQYDIDSTSGHNCNDDSEYQGRSVKYNVYQDPDDGYPCNNITPHNDAPDCGF